MVLIKIIELKRADAMELCSSLGRKFIGYFDKVYREPNKEVTDNLCEKMQELYDSVCGIRLLPNNKFLNGTQMRDWFYTFGSDSSEYFNNDDENEAYEEFIDRLEYSTSVRESLKGENCVGTGTYRMDIF